MGNTQHSLLSENNTKTQSERGKSQSPFAGSRSLITSKSPIRINEKGAITRNDIIAEGLKGSRMTASHIIGPLTPSNKQLVTKGKLVAMRELQHEQYLQNKNKNNNKNSILVNIASPSKKDEKQSKNQGERKSVADAQYQFNQSLLSNNDESQAAPQVVVQVQQDIIHMHQNLSQSNKKTISQMYGGSTITRMGGPKKFTFDCSDIEDQRPQRKSLEVPRENYSPEEYDTKVQVYYDQNKYVTIRWSSHNMNLTCGWLISEIMRHLMFEDDFNKRTHIIGMKNMNQKASECYDYLLTQLESPLHFIKDGDLLQIITPPEKFLLGSITSANSNFSPIFSETGTGHHVQPVTLEDFEFIKVIGKGGFSKVFQVRKKDTGKIYAMKTLSKAKIKRDNKVENILNERAILEQVSHPFIIQMKYAFQNEDYLFLILEFCAGGELFYRLNNIPQGRMTERQAKFYFAEILLAIQYLHDNQILYRDLKPENIVIDENGHIKLTDFGLSKIGFKMGDRAYSFCGSPEYMAPEMLLTEKNRQMGLQPLYHDKSLDFYHLGAILHEILVGLPPFFSEDRQKMYQDIIYAPTVIPSFLSKECQNLLEGLLQKDSNKRLGSKRGATDIKEHPWCADIDWDKFLRKEVQPPFRPFQDKSNFDHEYTSMNPILEDEDILVSLDDQSKPQTAGEFLNEYENRIAKSKNNKQIQEQLQHQQKLTRQHSIELYERENKTFRGYSFLQDAINPNILNHNTQGGFQDNEGFYFCLADSKDQSFTLGSPIQEIDCLSDGEMVNLYQRPSQINHAQMMNIDQEMMIMFQNQSKNQQSQQSILSEDVEGMKNNINQMALKKKDLEKNVKVQLQSNYLSKDGQRLIQQQQSKESLYNELLSTFDYSIGKKDRVQEQMKKNNNQTLSSMSLFSISQQNHMGSYLLSQGGEKYFQQNLSKFIEEKKMHNKSQNKDKLEFQKVVRKYSPEIDLQRALVQSKQKIANDLIQTIKQQQQVSSNNKKSLQISVNNNQLYVQQEGTQSRANSNNNTKVNNQKKTQQLYISEYGTFGNPKQSKLGTKKRTSETNSNRAGSPTDKILSKPQNTKKQSLSKIHHNSVLKQSQNQTMQIPPSSTKNNDVNSNNIISIQTNMKTSQLYSQVQTKVSSKKSRNQSNQNKDKDVQQNLNNYNLSSILNQDITENDRQQLGQNKLSLDQEFKIESNYQTLEEDHNLHQNPSGKFIVEQITANELLGSFLAQQSSHSSHHQILMHPNGDQTLIDYVGNSSLGSLGPNERSFEEVSKEAMAAMILNQSSESCCCSDDEFANKQFGVKKQSNLLDTSPKANYKVNKVYQNPRNLFHNAMQESINNNQMKHQANDLQFKKQLEEQKTINPIEEDNSSKYSQTTRKTLHDQKTRFFSDQNLATPVPQDERQLSPEEQQNVPKSNNASIINLNLQRNSKSINTSQIIQLKNEKKYNGGYTNSKLFNGGGSNTNNQKMQSPNQQTLNILNKTTPISPLRDTRNPVQGSQVSKLKERPVVNLKYETTSHLGQSSQQSLTIQPNITNQTSSLSLISSTPRGTTRQGGKMMINNKLSHTSNLKNTQKK